MVETDWFNQIYCKSCESMDEVPSESVSLLVTSPPYWNAIDYDAHIEDANQNYRPRQSMNYREYLDWLEHCFAQSYRTLKRGGHCAIVVGTVLLDGEHTPLPHHLVARMERTGFIFQEEITWYKVTGGVKRARVSILKSYPGYYYPNLMTEHILLFRKGGDRIYRNRTEAELEDSRWEVDREFTNEIANNIWHIAPVPPGQYPHPCPFPEEIPYRLIRLYSYRDEIILDPFMGIGTTAKVAQAMGRRWVGYETHEEYIRIALQRVNEPLNLREPLICQFNKLPRPKVNKPASSNDDLFSEVMVEVASE